MVKNEKVKELLEKLNNVSEEIQEKSKKIKDDSEDFEEYKKKVNEDPELTELGDEFSKIQKENLGVKNANQMTIEDFIRLVANVIEMYEE